jgi:hypothetical protein
MNKNDIVLGVAVVLVTVFNVIVGRSQRDNTVATPFGGGIVTPFNPNKRRLLHY